jgi:hypothetical protein
VTNEDEMDPNNQSFEESEQEFGDEDEMDPNNQSFGESEQECGNEDISRELNDSDLSKSIQPPVPGLFFQDKIKHARGLMDSASTQ